MKPILVAINDLLFLDNIQSRAQHEGYDVIHVPTADELLKNARQHVPSLIVIDINNKSLMPLECIRTLKQDPVLKKIKIVGYLPHVQQELNAAAIKAGCDIVVPRSAFVTMLPKLLCPQ